MLAFQSAGDDPPEAGSGGLPGAEDGGLGGRGLHRQRRVQGRADALASQAVGTLQTR